MKQLIARLKELGQQALGPGGGGDLVMDYWGELTFHAPALLDRLEKLETLLNATRVYDTTGELDDYHNVRLALAALDTEETE